MHSSDYVNQLLTILEPQTQSSSSSQSRSVSREVQTVLNGSTQAGVESTGVRGLGADATSSATTPGAQVQKDLNEQLVQITQQLTQARALQQSQSDALAENTKALAASTTTKSQSGGSTAGTIGGVLSSVFESLLGVGSIISGISSLFGGGQKSDPLPALSQYTAPAAQSFAGGISTATSGISGVDHDLNGGARPLTTSSQTAASHQITVQVQAMDSKSFLDHSDDIARAVRHAILQGSSLNDVLSEV